MDQLTHSHVLDYFEATLKDFVLRKLSHMQNWWNVYVPQEIRTDTFQRYEAAQKTNDVLNKQPYEVIDYLNFDGYGKIISRRDNWKAYFEKIFLDKSIFEHKMRIIQSLRNDIRHGRPINKINSIRLRLNCYDILSQIREEGEFDADQRKALTKKLGLD